MALRCIVVLGMHRSGTSALTGLLVALGCHAGRHLLPSNEFNAHGYFECSDIVAVHDELLDALGSIWHQVLPISPDWTMGPVAQKAKSRLISIFQLEYGTSSICVLKDPRMCRLLPLWRDVFAELKIAPSFIITARRPEEVAASLLRRNEFHANKSLLLYVSYLLDAERHTRSCRRTFVDFDWLLRDWEAALEKISSALDLALFPVSEGTSEKVRAFLSPELKHFNARPVSIDETADVPGCLARNLYQLLTKPHDEGFEASMDELRTRLDAYLQSSNSWLSLSAKAEQLEGERAAFGA